MPIGPLAWLGRWGTQAFIASVLLGLAAPALAAVARPLLPWTVFVFLTLMFLRTDLHEMTALLRRPWPLVLAVAWLIVVPPVGFWLVLSAVGRDNIDPGLLLGLAMQAAGPPLTSAPAIAMLLGLRPTLILAAVLATTLASPVTAPLLVDWVAGAAVPIEVARLVERLALLIGGGLAIALLLRVLAGRERIAAQAANLDGMAVLIYAAFGVAAMDGVSAATLSAPWRSLGFASLSFAIALAGFAATWMILRPLEPRDRLVIGYGTGMRNAALVTAALGTAVPDTAYLYFALSQLPIYCFPQLLRPVIRRHGAGDDGAASKRGTP